MKLIIASIILLSLTAMCSQTKYVPVITKETRYNEKIVRDSIYKYDSIFINNRQDTVFYEKYKYLTIDHFLTDSIFVIDTIRVPYPVEVIKKIKKPLTGWQTFQIQGFWILFLATGVFICIKVLK